MLNLWDTFDCDKGRPLIFCKGTVKCDFDSCQVLLPLVESILTLRHVKSLSKVISACVAGGFNWITRARVSGEAASILGFFSSPQAPGLEEGMQQLCPGLNASEMHVLYDRHHKVSSLIKVHQNTHVILPNMKQCGNVK